MQTSNPKKADLVFRAIGDPTRRSIIEKLSRSARGTPIGTITAGYSVSRQAVTKHVKVLQDAGLIRIERRGRERWCFAELGRLQIVYNWVAVYRTFWTEKLDALGEYLDEDAAGNDKP